MKQHSDVVMTSLRASDVWRKFSERLLLAKRIALIAQLAVGALSFLMGRAIQFLPPLPTCSTLAERSWALKER